MQEVSGYSLSRNWFEFAFEHSRKARPIHGALYFWIIEKNNRLNWITEFQLPTDEACLAVGAADRETILNALKDLAEWGFIKVVQESKNRFTARYVKLLHPKKSDAIPEAIPDASTYATPTNNKHINLKKKKEKKEFIPPSLEDVKKYFLESGYKVEVALKFYSSYSVADWHDSNDKPIKNWKQKAINVWFKDENKKLNSKSKSSANRELSFNDVFNN